MNSTERRRPTHSKRSHTVCRAAPLSVSSDINMYAAASGVGGECWAMYHSPPIYKKQPCSCLCPQRWLQRANHSSLCHHRLAPGREQERRERQLWSDGRERHNVVEREVRLQMRRGRESVAGVQQRRSTYGDRRAIYWAGCCRPPLYRVLVPTDPRALLWELHLGASRW